MDCITKLKEMKEVFTKTETKVAQYILGNLENIKGMRGKELGVLIGIRQSSISRFAKKLGYKGFPEFKIALSEAIIRKKSKKTKIVHDQISMDDISSEVIKKVAYQNIEAIKNTTSIVDVSDMEGAVDAICKARNIYILGAGFSGLVAKNLMYKLLEINLSANYLDDTHIQLTSMNNTTPDDLVFAISHSGQTYEIIKSVEIAQKNGAKIITLTKVVENPLSKLADIAIKTVAENVNFRLTAISSTITQLTVIDAIFILLSKINYEKNLSLAKKNTKTVKILKVKK